MLFRSAEAAGEKVWRLPLDPEYDDQIKSDVADIKNTGGRPAGSITAAKFIQRFVGDTPWVHFDIAGMADRSSDSGVTRAAGTTSTLKAGALPMPSARVR